MYDIYFFYLKIICNKKNHTPPRRKTSTEITVSISSAPSASKTAAVFILEACVQNLRISRASVQAAYFHFQFHLTYVHVKNQHHLKNVHTLKSWKKGYNFYKYISM